MPYVLTYADTADDCTVSYNNKSDLGRNGYDYPNYFRKTECDDEKFEEYRKVKEKYYFSRCNTFIMDYNQHYQEVKDEFNIMETMEIENSCICISEGNVVGFLLDRNHETKYYPIDACGKYLSYEDTICLCRKDTSDR